MLDRAVKRLDEQRAVLRGHTEAVNMVDVSPDGKEAVTASNDGTARVWDLATGAQRAVITTGDPNVIVARWSPTGDTILTAGDSGIPRLFTPDGKLVHALEQLSDMPSYMTPAFSPEGTAVLVPYIDGTLVLWDAATGKKLVTATSKLAHPVHAAITPDGKAALLWGAGNFAVEVRDARTLAFVATLEAHKRPIEKVAVSRTHVAVASRDKTITVWDQRTWQLVHHLRGDTNVVEDAAFDPDGKRLVTANRDGTARVWDVATGDVVAYLVGHQTAIRAARFSRDGSRVVTASGDGTARLWDASNGTPLATFEGHQRELTGIAVAPDVVVTCGLDATARVYPLAPDRLVLGAHASVPTTLSFSADRKRLAAGTANDMRVWDTAAAGSAVPLPGALDAKFDPRDPRRLAVVYPAELQLLNDQTVVARANVAAVLVAFLPDNRIAFASPDFGVRVWDPTSGAITKLATHTAFTNALEVADDLVISGSVDQALITRPSTGQSIALPTKEPIRTVALDPTHRYVVTGSTKTAKVWDARTGALLHSLATPENTVRVVFDARGHVLTIGGSEPIAQLWNLADGAHVTTLAGHTRPWIVGAVFLDDDLVATVGDETVRIWEAHSGRPLAILRTHGIAISTSASALPEIATTAYDRTVVVQSLRPRHVELEALRDKIRCLPSS